MVRVVRMVRAMPMVRGMRAVPVVRVVPVVRAVRAVPGARAVCAGVALCAGVAMAPLPHPGALTGVGAAGAAEVRWRGPSADAPSGTWQWPVSSHTPIAAYAAPPTRYAAGHRGIDLAVVPGTPVAAPADGVVRFAGVVVDRPVVTLDHGGGVLSSFEPVVAGLPAGSVVARGAVFGATASGGHCADACLHVGVRIDGEYVSPLRFFSRVPRAVLLPLGSPR